MLLLETNKDLCMNINFEFIQCFDYLFTTILYLGTFLKTKCFLGGEHVATIKLNVYGFVNNDRF